MLVSQHYRIQDLYTETYCISQIYLKKQEKNQTNGRKEIIKIITNKREAKKTIRKDNRKKAGSLKR